MELTWELTARLVVFATILSIAGCLYARHLANKFDREYGPEKEPPGK